MFTLVMKSNGCPNCHMVKHWLDAANVKEGTYKILLADDSTSDWMSFCKQHNVSSVPALVNMDTNEVTFGPGSIIDILSDYKKDE